MNKIHTVLFDVGDTLLGSDDIFVYITTAIGQDEKYTKLLKDHFFQAYLNARQFNLVADMMKDAMHQASQDAGVADHSRRASKLYSDCFTTTCHLFPETKEVLDWLKQHHIKMIIVSDADAPVLRQELEMLGLTEYFDDILISSEVGGYKPSDTTIAAVVPHCVNPLNGVIFVGDSRVDVFTAAKLGVTSVLIDRHGTSSVPADVRIKSLREIKTLVEDRLRTKSSKTV